MRFAAAVCFVLFTACAPDHDPARTASLLGVERLSITETATDRTITGLDGAGHAIASVTLHHGQVVMPDDDRTVEGHELRVTLRDTLALRYVNEGVLTDTTLPFLDVDGKGDRERFLTDARVAAALARWGVTFAERDPGLTRDGSDEAAYGACSNTRCTGAGNFELACCQSGDWQYVTCNTLGPGVLNERGCGNAPVCSGGGTYGANGCPAGQTATCGNGNFQNPSNPRLCMANACTDKAVGAAGCAVCAQTSANTGYWWAIQDVGSCSNWQCVQNGYNAYTSSDCCSGFSSGGICADYPTAEGCENLGSFCLGHCGGRYYPWQECAPCADANNIGACEGLGRPLPPESSCGDEVCTGFEYDHCAWECPNGIDCTSAELSTCTAIACAGGTCNDYLLSVICGYTYGCWL